MLNSRGYTSNSDGKNDIEGNVNKSDVYLFQTKRAWTLALNY